MVKVNRLLIFSYTYFRFNLLAIVTPCSWTSLRSDVITISFYIFVRFAIATFLSSSVFSQENQSFLPKYHWFSPPPPDNTFSYQFHILWINYSHCYLSMVCCTFYLKCALKRWHQKRIRHYILIPAILHMHWTLFADFP